MRYLKNLKVKALNTLAYSNTLKMRTMKAQTIKMTVSKKTGFLTLFLNREQYDMFCLDKTHGDIVQLPIKVRVSKNW